MLNFKASDQVNLDQIDSFRVNNPQEFELIVSELRKLAVNPNLSDTERKNVLQEYRRIIKTNQKVTLDGNILIGRSRTFRVADKFRKLY